MRRSLALPVLLSALVVTGAAAAPPASAADAPAQVSVVHGLRGVVADISLDGKTVLQGFGAERSTDPLPVAAGSHQVEVRKSGDTGPALISTAAVFQAGANLSEVAHIDPTGNPVLTPFVNDLSAAAAGTGRLAVRNAGAWPAAQFLVDDKPLGGTLPSGKEGVSPLSAGSHTLTVQAPDTGQVLLGAQSVQVPAGAVTAVYLIGSPQDSSLGWLVQNISLTSAAPGGVPTGNSGLKDRSTTPVPALLVALLGVVALAVRPARAAQPAVTAQRVAAGSRSTL